MSASLNRYTRMTPSTPPQKALRPSGVKEPPIGLTGAQSTRSSCLPDSTSQSRNSHGDQFEKIIVRPSGEAFRAPQTSVAMNLLAAFEIPEPARPIQTHTDGGAGRLA